MGERSSLVTKIHLLADLQAEAVELLKDRPRELCAGLPGKELEERLHQIEVGGDEVLDVRAQDLDCHLPTVEQRGPVHNGDGGSPDRSRIEGGEGLLETHAEILLDSAADLVEGDDGSGVETRAELVGHLLAEDARRGGEDLAELDEGAANVLEREPQGLGQQLRSDEPVSNASQLGPRHRTKAMREGLGDDSAALGQLQLGR